MFKIPTPDFMIIPVFNRLITGEAPWSRLLRDSPTIFTFFARFHPQNWKRIESFNNRTMKIFETVTPLGDPLNNFQSQFESHVRTEEFKHIKLVLTNALAKVYTRRLKAFNVHVVCHGKGLYLVKLFPTKVKRPITIKASGEFMARNNVTGEKSKNRFFNFRF